MKKQVTAASTSIDRLQLYLLGTPRVHLGDQPLTAFAHNKAQALLFYLAVTGQTHSRASIATLLWSEMTEAQAQNNLRTVLPELRHLVGQHLVIERQTVAFQRASHYWLDVEALRHGLKPSSAPVDLVAQQAAVALYQGEFLQGFYVRQAPVFESWVLEQREQLHTLVVNALTGLVSAYIQASDQAAALAANRQLLMLEPWSEPVHRQQMFLLAQLGEQAAALAQYAICRRVLAAEFGIEPLPETRALYEQIRLGEIRRQGDKGWGENVARSLLSGLSPSDIVAPTLAGSPRLHDEPTDTGRKPDIDGTMSAALPRLPVAGHHLPQQTKLYGRDLELARLQHWIVTDRCQLVGIFGIGGQGKTALAAAFVRTLAKATHPPRPQSAELLGGGNLLEVGGVSPFTRIIWLSLLNAPPLAEVMQEWFYVLSDQTVTSLPTSLDQQFSQLLAYLQRQRCLLILDNLESILQHEGGGGYYRPGYEAYGQLLQRLVAGEHHSCLLLTSREQPHDLAQLEEDTPRVRFLALAGLSADAGQAKLRERGVVGSPADLTALVQHYSGNPLALKLVADTVYSLFDGAVAAFLQADTLVFDDIREVLDQQFTRLTPIERELMFWLAIVREPVTYPVWRALLAQPPAARLILEAVRSLQRRSLVEKYDEGFGLQNVVLEYTTARLVEGVCTELFNADKETGRQGDTRQGDTRQGDTRQGDTRQGDTRQGDTEIPSILRVSLSPPLPVSLSLLNRYALILAQTKEYVRASQTRQLLQPVAEQLLTQLGAKGAEHQLKKLLALLQQRSQMHTATPSPGYAAANLLHLLLHLGVDLRGYDFSQLYLRQAHLRGVSLPQTNFAGATLMDSVFTEPFGIVYTAVFTPDGAYVAAGTSEGAIYLWRTADQQLAQVIQAHQHAVKQLSFAQWTTPTGDRHLLLASASDDKRVGFWSLAESGQVRQHRQLAHAAEQEPLIAVGLRPDGQRVTSVGIDGHVFVWDVGNPNAAQLVHHFATAFSRLRLVGFSGDGQTVAIGHRDGTVRLWQAATGEASLSLAGQTGLIYTLALSRDGQLLVTGGKEGHLCLWRLPAGELYQVLETNAGAIHNLAFSPDGKFLASGHDDLAVRLWTIDAQAHLHLQRTLLGHTQSIWSVVFGPALTPEPRPELREDSNRHIARQLLVTGSSDHTVRVWDVETGHTLYMLRGQPRVLAAHALHRRPQTQLAGPASTSEHSDWLLAAVGYDQLIHLWQGQGNQTDGTHRALYGARGPLYAVAISPDGHSVVSAGYDRTIYLWDIASGQLRQTFHGHMNRVFALAFHPDGKLLASGSGDGTVRLWRVPGAGALPAQPVAVLQADADLVHDLAFSPDGRFLSRGGTDRSLRLWDMTQSHYPEMVEARKVVQDESEEDILAVAFSPDGSKVACSGNHLIHVLDLQNGAAPLRLRHHTNWILSVAFSPDGATLVSSGSDCTVCLWDVSASPNTSVTAGALRATLRGHSETVYKVAFTPDGTAVVSSSFDGTIKFWDSQTGDCINTLRVEGPYAGMNITGITGVTEAQKAALKALGAVEG